MTEERCVCCGEIIPEGQQTCINCEQRMMKIGAILQSHNATEEEVAEVYDIFKNTDAE